MANIELVIKINEEQYKFIKQSMTFDAVKNYPALLYDICEYIMNGTLLPKGHGDLIDRKELLKQLIDKANYPSNYVRIAPTIIEADKIESE